MFKRNLEPLLHETIKEAPVLLMSGARQVGKTTLVQSIFKNHRYFTLEDSTLLASIKKDPLTFLSNLHSPIIIDEVQRAPELFLPLKKVVDAKRRPGFFVLISSANVLNLQKLSEALADRMQTHILWPLSQGEILGRKEEFIERLFNKEFPPFDRSLSLETLAEKILKGGYPNAITKKDLHERITWLKEYLTTLLEKDIQGLANIEGLSKIPDLLHFLASRIGDSLNTSQISRSVQLSNATLRRYLTLLQTIFIVTPLPCWSKNFAQKSRKSKFPKIYLNDTGFLMDILSMNKEKLLSQKSFFGPALKNFVVMEILKQQTWNKIPFKTYHYSYRPDINREVSILLEASDGRIIGIETKLSKNLDQNDFEGLEFLEKSVGKNFYRGLVLYMGDKTLPFGNNKYAVPLPALWEM